MKPNQTEKCARIVIVDDHPAVREALVSRIGRQPDLEVCGEAADMGEALRLVAELQPDLVVIDISLKTGSGIDLIKRIKDRNESVPMLVWSMHSEALYAERALRAGALGYINKDQATDKIVEAIRRVLEGKVFLSDAMAEKMLRRSVGGSRREEINPSLLQSAGGNTVGSPSGCRVSPRRLPTGEAGLYREMPAFRRRMSRKVSARRPSRPSEARRARTRSGRIVETPGGETKQLPSGGLS